MYIFCGACLPHARAKSDEGQDDGAYLALHLLRERFEPGPRLCRIGALQPPKSHPAGEALAVVRPHPFYEGVQADTPVCGLEEP